MSEKACGNCRYWSYYKDCPLGMCRKHPIPIPVDACCDSYVKGKPKKTGEPKLDSPIGITCDE